MKTLLVSVVTTLGLIVNCALHAASPPASAPAGTTGMCKDGTWYSGASKKGACHGHQGVKEWYGAADESSTSTTMSKSSSKDTSSSTSSTSSGKKTASATTATSTSTTSATSGPRPSDATGLCNDGTYYTGENKKGACRGHKGVKDWYGASDTSKTTAATTTKSTSPTATPAPATMPPQTFPKSTPTTMPNAQTPTTGTQTGSRGTLPGGTSATPAAGGGAGKVWVNTSSKVYHCQGDRYYGATKEGEYMSEADAIAKGNRAAHGKSCSS